MTKKNKILVIGDLVLDVYHRGQYLGHAADTKMPAAREKSTKLTWGGAGLLVRNILALGGKAYFISLLGEDDFTVPANKFIHTNLQKIFFKVPGRVNTVEEFFWIQNKKMLHWRHFDNSPIAKSLRDKVIKAIRLRVPLVDKVIIADYRHGLLSPALAREIINLCKKANKPLYIDSQIFHNTGNHHWYRGADTFCLNQTEAKSAEPNFNLKKLSISLRRLQKVLCAKNIIVKLGEHGSVALVGDTHVETVAYPVRVLDPVGAGDAFLAAISLGDIPLAEANFKRASIWAALSTTIIGTEIPSIAKFRKIISKI